MHSLITSLSYCLYWPGTLTSPHPSPYGSVDIHMNAHIPYPSKMEEYCTYETLATLPTFTRCKNPWAESASKYSPVYFSNSCFEVYCRRQYWQIMKSEDCFNYAGRQLCVFNTHWCKLPDMCSVLMKTHLCTCCPDTVTEKLHIHSVEAATLQTSCEK